MVKNNIMKTKFIASLLLILGLTSCEIAIDQPDPFEGVLPCMAANNIIDFCKIEIKPGLTSSQIIIHDENFPDIGQNEYLALVQWVNVGNYQCTVFPETMPFNITVSNNVLSECRIIIIRTTVLEDGSVFQQVESPFFRVYNFELIN